MNLLKFDSAELLVQKIEEIGSIHVECNQEIAKLLWEQVRKLEDMFQVGYVLHTDKGYQRYTIKSYLKLWRELHGSNSTLEHTMRQFGLWEIAHKKLGSLGPGEQVRVQLARVSMQVSDLIYLEEPLLNLDGKGTELILKWIVESCEAGKRFITTNASLRHALLMPGTAFYMEENRFYQVEQEEETVEDSEEELKLLRIAAKSGNATLLFEAKDIDYVESLNKCNYVSVRGTMFQVSYTMDELEELLRKSGFFRCHRSYIVNMQKVEQIEKLSRNSYALLLNDKAQNRLPLAKGRVGEMKETFGW